MPKHLLPAFLSAALLVPNDASARLVHPEEPPLLPPRYTLAGDMECGSFGLAIGKHDIELSIKIGSIIMPYELEKPGHVVIDYQHVTFNVCPA